MVAGELKLIPGDCGPFVGMPRPHSRKFQNSRRALTNAIPRPHVRLELFAGLCFVLALSCRLHGVLLGLRSAADRPWLLRAADDPL